MPQPNETWEASVRRWEEAQALFHASRILADLSSTPPRSVYFMEWSNVIAQAVTWFELHEEAKIIAYELNEHQRWGDIGASKQHPPVQVHMSEDQAQKFRRLRNLLEENGIEPDCFGFMNMAQERWIEWRKACEEEGQKVTLDLRVFARALAQKEWLPEMGDMERRGILPPGQQRG